MNFKNAKRKIGLYGRELSQDQVEKGFNLEGQFDKCHDWLNIYSDQYSGERLEYIEKAMSGTKWRRKELQRLIIDIKKGMVGVVIIHNLD